MANYRKSLAITKPKFFVFTKIWQRCVKCSQKYLLRKRCKSSRRPKQTSDTPSRCFLFVHLFCATYWNYMSCYNWNQLCRSFWNFRENGRCCWKFRATFQIKKRGRSLLCTSCRPQTYSFIKNWASLTLCFKKLILMTVGYTAVTEITDIIYHCISANGVYDNVFQIYLFSRFCFLQFKYIDLFSFKEQVGDLLLMNLFWIHISLQ